VRVETLSVEIEAMDTITVAPAGSSGIVRLDIRSGGGISTFWMGEQQAAEMRSALDSALRPRVVDSGGHVVKLPNHRGPGTPGGAA
jgi:hypothetical protein